ncbi:hypothetical protein BGZ99_008287 [Dissophora globulifera]|uniref:Uncharacterized protein n=1 Tax=Dissophora globulifera TaxID=979702 RepID=A0A9P6R8J8_9FUNG|nr:hypothetical protein BGZ99_008287 [Dissophora globulifera]
MHRLHYSLLGAALVALQMSLTTAQAPPPVPLAAAAMSYASDGDKMYIQGGVNTNGGLSLQFWSLNLAANWTVDSPAWMNHTDEMTYPFSGGAGTVTKSGDFVATGRGPAVPGILCIYHNMNLTVVQKPTPLLGTGPVIASDPNTGDVYFMGDGVVMDSSLAKQTLNAAPLVSTGQAVSWHKPESSIISTYVNNNTGSLDLQMFSPSKPDGWKSLNTPSIIGQRTGHCFVPNDDGSKYFLFGGSTGDTVHNDLFTYDVATNAWQQTPSSVPVAPRTNMACVMAGSTLVIWGGFSNTATVNTTGSAASGVATDTRPMLFDSVTRSWVTTFAAVPSDDVEIPVSKSHVGAIVGGVVGGVAFVVLMAGLFVFMRRRNARQGGIREAPSDTFRNQKAEISDEEGYGPVEMGGYTAAPGANVAYGSPAPGQVMPAYYQTTPPIPQHSSLSNHHSQLAPVSGVAHPTIIQSPFEDDHSRSVQNPLLPPGNNGFPSAPALQPVSRMSGSYHDRPTSQGTMVGQGTARRGSRDSLNYLDI